MLQVKNVSGGYEHREVVRNVSFQIKRGKIVGILGPNGSGKSTLLKLVSGILKPNDGEILINGKALSFYSSKELAQKMAVLPQLHANAFSNTVLEVVSLGRYPYQKGLFSSWSAADEKAVKEAIEATGIQCYVNNEMTALSGGEQQRVFIAQALAQQSELLILDEPTNHLDISHQKQILDLIKQQSKESNLTVLSVFHDINLAALYCDELILMKDGKIRVQGKPHEVILENKIQSVYEAAVMTYAHPEIPKPQITVLPNTLSETEKKVTLNNISIANDYIKLEYEKPLKTISSAVHNAGLGWFTTFLNRSVDPNYHIDNVNEETEHFLIENKFSLTNTVVMLTVVSPRHVVMEQFHQDGIEIIVAVTAGVGNAIDVSKSYLRKENPYIGTINTWIIINGKLTDQAFYQAMMTATESKVKALADECVYDKVTNTVATGTGTDSLLIATTQQGTEMMYAGTLTSIGQLIGRGVYEVTKKAIQNYQDMKRNG